MLQFPIPASLSESEWVAKKNRFIAIVDYFEGRDALAEKLAQVKSRYPGARHYCYAFIGGAPNDGVQMGMSDDGEPSGTAGKPMLAVLQGSDIGHILAVVVRYSSGIKLGTGGLVRAYSTSLKQALEQLDTSLYVKTVRLGFTTEYSQVDAITRTLHQLGGEISQVDYGVGVSMVVTLPQAQQESLQIYLQRCAEDICILTN
tara:strand:- start:329 stop:934 length:606 start_codon:yes stop_codon:yes gene_type:complete